MAASLEFTVAGVQPWSSRPPFQSAAASFVSGVPPSHAAKARTSRRYFSMVPALRSSCLRYCPNDVTHSSVMLRVCISPPPP